MGKGLCDCEGSWIYTVTCIWIDIIIQVAFLIGVIIAVISGWTIHGFPSDFWFAASYFYCILNFVLYLFFQAASTKKNRVHLVIWSALVLVTILPLLEATVENLLILKESNTISGHGFAYILVYGSFGVCGYRLLIIVGLGCWIIIKRRTVELKETPERLTFIP